MKNINNNIYVSFEFLALATEEHFPGIKLELNVKCTYMYVHVQSNKQYIMLTLR